MYYLYDKKSKGKVTKLDYEFNSFKDFYGMANSLTRKLTGAYTICIQSKSREDVMDFLNRSSEFNHLTIYISLEQTLYDWVLGRKPGVSTLAGKDDYLVFTDLITQLNLRLAPKCAKQLFWAMKHDYVTMSENLSELKHIYGNQMIDMDMIERVIPLDQIVYPRSVCIAYLRLDKSRKVKLKKSVEMLGSKLVYNAIKKNVKKLLEEKNNFYKTGTGSDLIKTIPYHNLLKMYYAFVTAPWNFNDITILLNLYEKGVYLNDYIQEDTI